MGIIVAKILCGIGAYTVTTTAFDVIKKAVDNAIDKRAEAKLKAGEWYSKQQDGTKVVTEVKNPD